MKRQGVDREERKRGREEGMINTKLAMLGVCSHTMTPLAKVSHSCKRILIMINCECEVRVNAMSSLSLSLSPPPLFSSLTSLYLCLGLVSAVRAHYAPPVLCRR